MSIISSLPIEIINKILIFRPKHPVAKLFCCRVCSEDWDWRYPIIYSYQEHTLKTQYFYILCGDCLYDACKD
jgi:hypothetical protein